MHFLISPTDWGLDRLKDKNPTQISASLLVSTIFWSRSRKYTFFWSQSRIFMNKSLGLACWDCTCSVSVSVSNLKNWSLVYRSYRKISKSLGLSLGLDHFPGLGLGLSLENTYFPGLGLSLEYSWTRVSVSLVETVSLQSRSRLLRLYLLSLGLSLEP